MSQRSQVRAGVGSRPAVDRPTTSATPRQCWLRAGLVVSLLATAPGTAGAQSASAQLRTAFANAQTLHSQGKYAQAIPDAETAYRLAPSVFGASSENTATITILLADIYRDSGQPARALPLYQHALKLRESLLGRDHEKVAMALSRLAGIHERLGKYAEAEPLYLRCLKISEARLGPNHVDTAIDLSNLALIYLHQAKYAQAIPYLERSLKIKEAQLGKNHSSVGHTLNKLAHAYQQLGQYDQAQPLYERNLAIWEREFGRDHPNVAMVHSDLGNVLQSQQRYRDAQSHLERSLQIRRATLGANHPDLAASLTNLGNNYLLQSQFAAAVPLYEQSLRINEAVLGPDHPDVSITLRNLATLYRAQGQFTQAESMYQRCLKIETARFGEDHPNVARLLGDLSRVQAALGRWSEANTAADRSRRIVRRHVARVLPALSEREQLVFLRNTDRESFERVQALAWAQRESADVAALSAGWVLNGKSVAQQTLAERALLAQSSSNPATAQLTADLSKVRKQLAALTIAAVDAQQASRPQQLATLQAQERELTKKLAQAASRPVRDDPWVELREVRQALPADAVLIEFSRFPVHAGAAKPDGSSSATPRYAAWLIPPADHSELRLIDLGEATAIDAAIRTAREVLQGAPQRIPEIGERESEAELRAALSTVADRVLQPLLPHIQSYPRWILSPDGALWLLPWSALPLDTDAYVVERHTLTYAVSGRDLALRPSGTLALNPPLLMADPNFDLGAAQAQSEARRILKGRTQLTDLRAGPGSLGGVRWSRLPGTAAEARAITPPLAAYAGAQPYTYTGDAALEGVFKAFVRPRVAVLSTHGFFLPDQSAAFGDNPAVAPTSVARDGQPLENPLLRCGLVLTGANQRTTEATAEDGVLTGLEVVGQDLRGVELVVLSACETGLGDVQNSEGVSGLRQAFQLAGVQSVVATLWQIPDQDTARLMTGFFQALASGRDHGTALTQSQREQIAARRGQQGTAHPYFWAAFTLTGTGRLSGTRP